jgi:prevent-host-death family protein
MARRTRRKGAEEARKELPSLLAAAERGQATVITKRGRPVAALIPIKDYSEPEKQLSLLPLACTGRGLWGEDSAKTIRELKEEWERF